jgi:Zn-dependent protease with chaperone function
MSTMVQQHAVTMALEYKREGTLFRIGLAISIVLWLALIVGTFGIALIYLLFAFLIYVFAQSAFISYLRGTATRIDEAQFPDLHRRVRDCCARLELDKVPDAYLLHAGGAFNAFATRFFGRDFIVLYSDVVDALEAAPEAINFYIGHELGHVRRKHLQWAPVLFPASLLPLFGAAYSRAREYTCDLHGLACCPKPEDAARGLAALSAGSRRWQSMDLGKYAGQAEAAGSFWMSFHELISGYPWLVKRVAHVLGGEHLARVPGRNPFAWLLALFVPNLGRAGGGASVLITIAVIGILAAVALPAYQDYTSRVKLIGALGEGLRAGQAVGAYYAKNGTIPGSLAQAGFAPGAAPEMVRQVTVDPKSGVLRVDLAFAPLQGKALVLTPSLDANQRVVWKCSGEDIRPQVLPPRCRGDAPPP